MAYEAHFVAGKLHVQMILPSQVTWKFNRKKTGSPGQTERSLQKSSPNRVGNTLFSWKKMPVAPVRIRVTTRMTAHFLVGEPANQRKRRLLSFPISGRGFAS